MSDVVHIPERLGSWPKLSNYAAPALLHAKFWGRSMADEEQKWRMSQQGNEAQGEDARMEVDDIRKSLKN